MELLFCNAAIEPGKIQKVEFKNPKKIFIAWSPYEFIKIWENLKKEDLSNHWVAGFLSYETGYLWEERLQQFAQENPKVPYILLGIFSNPRISIENLPILHIKKRLGTYKINHESYKEKIIKIQKHLQQGNVYQVNYTFSVEWDWDGNSQDLFYSLLNSQKVPYAAYLYLEKEAGFNILSLSPELFLKLEKKGDEVFLLSKPMKGTAPRYNSQKKDKNSKHFLQSSSKIQAENLMITDLIRNDLGKIAKLGSVKVNKLFHVESYETVHQMVSEISCSVLPNISFWEILERLFPSGSVTGAPKIKSMEIIHDLEEKPRGVYTGTIGYLPPHLHSYPAIWNVAIRTLEHYPKEKKMKMGVGSGIVMDSNPEEEWNECLEKIKFTQSLNHGY